MNEPTRLPVEDAAQFVANSFTKEYQRRCVERWRELHGDEYADAVQARAFELIRKKRAKR